MHTKAILIRAMAMAWALAALTAGAGAAGDAGPVAVGAGREAAAIKEKMAAAKTQDERDALWAELAALPASAPPGWKVPAPGGPEDETAKGGPTELPEPDGELVLTPGKGDALAGEFGRAGSSVAFRSTVGASGDAAVSVEVNGHTLDATYSARSNLIKSDGHGYALSAEDKDALRALVHEFERAGLGVAKLGSNAPAREDWLYRAVNLWSDAPVGYPLLPLEFARPKAPDAGAPASGGATTLGAAGGGPAIGWDFVYHTGFDGHWVNAAASTGPCEKDCVARCGAGCPWFPGGAVYYWGCARHDMCCGAHGNCYSPSDANCGDEYAQASDGYFMQNNYSSCGTYSDAAPREGWGLSQVVADMPAYAYSPWSLRSGNTTLCYVTVWNHWYPYEYYAEVPVACSFTDSMWWHGPGFWEIAIRTVGWYTGRNTWNYVQFYSR